MSSAHSARLSLAAVAVLAVLPFVAAPAVGEDIVEGVITNVDLHGEPRHITVGNVDVRIHVVRTHINFLDPADAQVSPELSNLRPGMQVRAAQGGGDPSRQIDILSIPQGLRGQLIKRSDPNADKRTANQPSYPPLPGGGGSSGNSGGNSGGSDTGRRRR